MASSSSTDYADGTVIELTMGSAELDPILQSTSSKRQLVLLDFSVSWCGPCRMLAPVLHQIATEMKGKVAVLKMDCEKSPANRALAASAGISAYPTLKIYSRGQVVETIRGANPQALRQALDKHLQQLGPGVGAPQNLALELARALSKVKAACNFEDFVTASKTLAAYVGNIVNNPNDPKYRKIKLSSAGFQSRLASKPGGKECLLVLGFQERQEAMENVLVLDEVPPQLGSVLGLLNQAIADAERSRGDGGGAAPAVAAATPPPAAPPSTTAPAAAAAAGPSPQQLAQLLAQSMRTDGAAGSSAAPQPIPAGAQPRRRVVKVTPAKLARVLAKIMIESGIGKRTEA